MAVCKSTIHARGAFQSREYFHDGTNKGVDENLSKHGKKDHWGPLTLTSAKMKNQIRLKNVLLSFCVEHCKNGLAKYEGDFETHEWIEMEEGTMVTTFLKNSRKQGSIFLLICLSKQL